MHDGLYFYLLLYTRVIVFGNNELSHSGYIQKFRN